MPNAPVGSENGRHQALSEIRAAGGHGFGILFRDQGAEGGLQGQVQGCFIIRHPMQRGLRVHDPVPGHKAQAQPQPIRLRTS